MTLLQIKSFKTIALIILALLVYSCKQKDTCVDKEITSGIIESNYEFGKCFYFLDSATYVINNLKEYQYLVNQIDSTYAANIMPDCANYELYSIDFSNITLLAQYAEGNGCSVGFERNVSIDEINKQYIYTIQIYECGSCQYKEVSMNWVQVPKLPEDYTVSFTVKYN